MRTAEQCSRAHAPRRPHTPCCASGLFYARAQVGLDQAGLGELVAIALRRCSAAEQAQLVGRTGAVLLCGGGGQQAGLHARLQAELVAAQPAGGAMRVVQALDASLDAWRGAAGAAQGGLTQRVAISRAEYEEHGAERLRLRGVLTHYY